MFLIIIKVVISSFLTMTDGSYSAVVKDNLQKSNSGIFQQDFFSRAKKEWRFFGKKTVFSYSLNNFACTFITLLSCCKAINVGNILLDQCNVILRE